MIYSVKTLLTIIHVNVKPKKVSLYCSVKSLMSSRFLAVPATLSPRFKAASAHTRPNPLDAPVIKIVLPFYLIFVSTKLDRISG
jgi:hypothetical protein